MVQSSQLQFYLARVAQARAEANEATLQHVRERCHRSEAAWASLAARLERNEARRAAKEK